jgi:hypothetical protein
MKRALLLFAVAITVASCTKEGIVAPGLFGKWELRANYGGLAGFNNKYEPGNGNTIQFKSDSTYVLYRDHQLEKQGKFSLNITSVENDTRYGILYLDGYEFGDEFKMNADSMTIGTTVTDNVASDYVKIQ